METAQGQIDGPETASALSGRAAEPTPPSSPRPRTRRKWLLRLMLVILAPALLLGLAEGGLRLGGYGHSTRFFVPVPGQDTWSGNDKFAWQFTSARGAP